MTVERSLSINRMILTIFFIILTAICSFTFMRVSKILDEVQALRVDKAAMQEQIISLTYSEHNQDRVISENKDYCIRNYEANRDRIDKVIPIKK